MSSAEREHGQPPHYLPDSLPDSLPEYLPAGLDSFAAGLGHELSNVVAALKIRLDCLLQDVADEGVVADLQAMRGTLDKARRLSDGLRLLAADPSGSDLGEGVLLEDWRVTVEPMLRAAAPRGWTVSLGLTGRGTGALAVPAALTKIAFTLVDAICRAPGMPAVGRVEMSVRGAEPGIELSVSHVRNPMDWAKDGGAATGVRRQRELGDWVRHLGGMASFDCDGPGGVSITVKLGVGASRPVPRTAPRVFVGVEQARTRAVILSELEALSCDATGDPKQRAACELEVVDALRPPPRHPWRVVLLADGSHAEGGNSVLPIGRNPKVSTIRETLRRVLNESR